MIVRRSRHVQDDGAILVIALLFIGVISLMIVALVSTTTSVVGGARGKRDFLAKSSAADAGLQYALQQVRARSELCPSSASSGLLNPPPSFIAGVVNGASTNIEVRVSCQIVVNSLLGSGGYALVTRDSTANSALTSGATGAQLPINGPVYLSGNPQASSPTSQGDLSFAMSNGDVIMAPQAGVCPPVPAHMTLAGPPFGYACSSTAPAPPPNLLPASVGTARTLAPAFTTSANCAGFLPGSYDFSSSGTQQPLALLRHNYFVSGVYYFNNVLISLKRQDLVGGASKAAEIAEDANGGGPIVTPCMSDANALAKVAYTAVGTGVKIVLGPNAAILVDNPDGQIELFGRQGGNAAIEGLQGVSLMTAQSTQSGFVTNNLGFADQALTVGKTSGGGGSTLAEVIHGFVYTPNTGLQVRINSIPARFFSGIDTGRLDIGTSAIVSGFSISVPTQPAIRQYQITAVACGKSGADSCTSTYDGGQNIKGTATVSVNSSTQAAAVVTYHVGSD